MITLPDQLSDALDILTRHGLQPWVDTGTALGLARKGGVLWKPGADDLDISIWYSDLQALTTAAADFVEAGYRQEVWSWRGVVFKWKFLPKDPFSAYPIDIKLYQRSGDYCWTPLVYSRSPPTRLFSSLWIRLRKLLVKNKETLSLGEWPLNIVISAYTFWVPTRFFDELIPWKETRALVPKDLDSFLTLHYGDWRKPSARWNSVTNDGSVIQKSPKYFVSNK